ncbi:MAG TPA: 6-phosphogluconolactonase [Steroidobacteraceae bacterium]|nr:6-phosphogluconolactonase [Steroidobacteraceae bacterium]
MAPAIDVRRFASRGELDAALAERLVRACSEPGPRSTAAVMLAGGGTPSAAYRLAASASVAPRPHLHILYSDERYVPPASDASNYGMSRALLEALALPEARILRVRTELPLEAAADDYDARLAQLMASGIGIGLGLLGLGADGHTAALFSAADVERGAGRLAIAVRRPDGRDAVSVTPELIARIVEPLFAAAGKDKRAAAAALLRGDRDLVAWRAVAGCARVALWTDAEAYPQDRFQL